MPQVNLRPDHVGEHATAYRKNRKRIIMAQNVCAICGKEVDKTIKNKHDPMVAEVDHIVPISRGGHPSDINNLQLTHRICNQQKKNNLINFKERFRDDNLDIRNDDLPLHFDWKTFVAK